MVNLLSDCLYASFTHTPDMLQHMGKFTRIIVDLCMFGGLVKRGIRYAKLK